MNKIKEELQKALNANTILIKQKLIGSCKNYIIQTDQKNLFLKAYYNSHNRKFTEIIKTKAHEEIREKWIKNKVNIPTPLKSIIINKVLFEVYEITNNKRIELTEINIKKIIENIKKIQTTRTEYINDKFKNDILTFPKVQNIKNESKINTIINELKKNIDNIEFCVCHGDLTLKNIYSERNKILFRDFENIDYLPKIYDLSKLIISAKLANYSEEIIQKIIDEYTTEINPNNIEIENIENLNIFILITQILAYQQQQKNKEADELIRNLNKIIEKINCKSNQH
ncbi:hypothetical protein JXM83_06150 [Candidatus Woesearchaeota archaeon]|nr:hypothetical protein [Candidatus Woesearchaeota archaeon]